MGPLIMAAGAVALLYAVATAASDPHVASYKRLTERPRPRRYAVIWGTIGLVLIVAGALMTF